MPCLAPNVSISTLGRRKEAADSLSQLHRPNVPDCLSARLVAETVQLLLSSAANVVRKNARPKFKLRGKISTVVAAAADLLTLPSPRRRSAIMMMGGALLWHTNAGEKLLNAHEHSWPNFHGNLLPSRQQQISHAAKTFNNSITSRA